MKMVKKKKTQQMHLRRNPAWADHFKSYRRILMKYNLCHSVNLINAISIMFLPAQEEFQAGIASPKVQKTTGTSI